MTVLLDIILPFFALMGLGYLAQARRVLGEGGTEILNSFVFWFALPALLFRVMANIQVSEAINIDFILVYAGVTFILSLLAFVIGRALFLNSTEEATVAGMNAAYGNTGYLGIPLSLLAFGETAAAPTIITTIVSTTLAVVSMGIITATRQKDTSITALFGNSLLMMVKNPLVIAPLAGIMVAILGLKLPSAINGFTELLGSAATPCALFSVGMFLYGKPIRGDLSEVAFTCALKLLLFPVLVWGALNTVFSVPLLWEAVAVIMAATPIGAGSFVLSKQFLVYEQRTSSAILLSTLLSIITLFLLLNYYLPRIS